MTATVHTMVSIDRRYGPRTARQPQRARS